MSPIGSQVIIRLRDSRVIAPQVHGLRQVAQGVSKVGQPFPLVVYRLADNHLHALLTCGEVEATEFGRRVEISLSKRLNPGVPHNHVHIVPVNDQRHLRTLFHYILRQEAHHGTALDPLFEASNLPDLLGMRLLGGWTIANVRAALPRLKREELEAHLPVRLADAVRDHSILQESACAAGALMSLRGRRAEVTATRAAAAALGVRWGATGVTAEALGMARSSVAALRLNAEPALVRAIEEQARLRVAWRGLQRARWA